MSGSVTLGGGSSGTAVTIDNSYVSSHLQMFQALTAEYASSSGVYLPSSNSELLLAPDNVGTVAVFGAAQNLAVVAGTGDSLAYVGLSGNATVAGSNGNSIAVAGTGNDVFALGSGHNQIYLGTGNSTVFSAGTDKVQVGAGDASVVVTGTNASIVGGAGALSVDASAGNGTGIIGGDGATTIVAPTAAGASLGVVTLGNTTVSAAGSGETAINQTSGSLTFVGQGGSVNVVQSSASAAPDRLFASNGSTVVLSGSTANNIFVANSAAKGDGGNVALDGAAASGGNQFWAGSGNATLIGGAGNDTLVGGAGASTLTGGGGANLFALFSVQDGSGTQVTVTDFNASDTLTLFGYGSSGLQYALSHSAQSGANTVIALSDGSRITLDNFNHSQLTPLIRAT